MRAATEIRSDLAFVRAEIDRQFWLFTRTARGKPVASHLYVTHLELEKELREALHADRRNAQNVPPPRPRERRLHGG